MRRVGRKLALFVGMCLLATLAAPGVAAATTAEAESIDCNPQGYVGRVVCTTLGLACILLEFLLGPGWCAL